MTLVVVVRADRPERPVDVALSACQQTFAVVRWSPAADNNAPITGFIVYYTTSHDRSSTAAAARPSSGSTAAPHIGARVGQSWPSTTGALAI